MLNLNDNITLTREIISVKFHKMFNVYIIYNEVEHFEKVNIFFNQRQLQEMFIQSLNLLRLVYRVIFFFINLNELRYVFL